MTFQEQINLLRAGEVPMPLLTGQATAQAVRLRQSGLSYTSIAVVMATYHGWRLSGAGWRVRCRAAGVPGKPLSNGTMRLPPQRKQAS